MAFTTLYLLTVLCKVRRAFGNKEQRESQGKCVAAIQSPGQVDFCPSPFVLLAGHQRPAAAAEGHEKKKKRPATEIK